MKFKNSLTEGNYYVAMSGGTGYKWRSCSTEWLLVRGAWLAVGLIERQQLNMILSWPGSSVIDQEALHPPGGSILPV